MSDAPPDGSKRAAKAGLDKAGQQRLLPIFGDSFLQHHAGRVITDPAIAIVELVANAWDAGAGCVKITWPTQTGGVLAVDDNGGGMTKKEFEARWPHLNYNRHLFQGPKVEFPKGVRSRPRRAFGRNGVGRHAAFCFAAEYSVETSKAGRLVEFRVTRETGRTPFRIRKVREASAKSTGTCIRARSESVTLTPEAVADLLGARFVADPDFSISVNGQPVRFTDLEHLSERYEIDVPELGAKLPVWRFDSEKVGRTSQQHGVAFWVNRRAVGEPTWDIFGSPLLDSRGSTAKRFTYIIEADPLEKHVRQDWSGFHASVDVNAVRRATHDFVNENLGEVLADIRRERKRAALSDNRQTLRRLPPLAQEFVASFADEVQSTCPTICERDLNNVVTILAKMEKTRAGYGLLEKLATWTPKDYDTLDEVLESWSITDVKQVLGVLRYRLDLIQQLEVLIDSPSADELHDLQPLFEHGLWMFGPEFESVSFTSNRTLSTIVAQHFGGAVLSTPRKRPDFVVLPDSSIGVYSCDSFDEQHEVNGYATVVVVELKKGGFEVTYKEKDQALGYARELRTSGKVGPQTKIVCHVLGSKVLPAAVEHSQEGPITVIPRPYSVLLRQAHARTFNLLKQIKSSEKWRSQDADLNAVIADDLLERAEAV